MAEQPPIRITRQKTGWWKIYSKNWTLGEWFYQAESSTLYYYPMPDEDAETAVFETPILKHLIEFRGSEQQPVTHITIQGIELTQTLRTFMDKYEPLLRSDWMVYRGMPWCLKVRKIAR